MKNKSLSLILGLVTAVLLAAALWPQEEAAVTVVVAARDLGAGATLRSADLTTVSLPVSQAPSDGVADPDALLGKSLAVVRFSGEAITPRHIGVAVTLQANERGIAVKVAADTGLAGLIQPGQKVGLVATVQERQSRQAFAKTLIEDVRVLYVSPSFRARPDQPITYRASVQNGQSAEADAQSQGYQPAANEGIVVLAAITDPMPILYEAQETLHVRAIRKVLGLDEESLTVSDQEDPFGLGASIPEEQPPQVVWGVPVEMIAALNAADASFTLVLQPEDAAPYTTPGFDLKQMLSPISADGEQSLFANR